MTILQNYTLGSISAAQKLYQITSQPFRLEMRVIGITKVCLKNQKREHADYCTLHKFRTFALTPSEIKKTKGVEHQKNWKNRAEHQDSKKNEKYQGDEKNCIKAKVCMAMNICNRNRHLMSDCQQFK